MKGLVFFCLFCFFLSIHSLSDEMFHNIFMYYVYVRNVHLCLPPCCLMLKCFINTLIGPSNPIPSTPTRLTNKNCHYTYEGSCIYSSSPFIWPTIWNYLYIRIELLHTRATLPPPLLNMRRRVSVRSFGNFASMQFCHGRLLCK